MRAHVAGLTLTFALSLAIALPAQDGWQKLTGDWVPELKVKAWLNTPDGKVPTTTSLKGKVWLLMFFLASDDGCLAQIPELQKLHDKHFDAGFRVLAISNEPLRDLQEKVVGKHKATFWIGSDFSNDTFKGFLENEKQFVIPKLFLVDVEGKVVGNKVPSEKLMQKLPSRVFDIAPGKDLEPELEILDTAYGRGAYGGAWQAAAKFLSNKDEAVAKDAKFVREKVEAYAAFRKKTMAEDLGVLMPAQQFGKLLLLRSEFLGMELQKWADEQLKPLRLDKKIKSEKNAWAKLESALERELKKFNSSYQRKQAVKLYRSIMKKYAKTEAAHIAEARLDKMAVTD
ncbi:MAG: peroxiredoxin family protein [Planctomycetota bacterium]|jgi:peroxiredoxin